MYDIGEGFMDGSSKKWFTAEDLFKLYAEEVQVNLIGELEMVNKKGKNGKQSSGSTSSSPVTKNDGNIVNIPSRNSVIRKKGSAYDYRPIARLKLTERGTVDSFVDVDLSKEKARMLNEALGFVFTDEFLEAYRARGIPIPAIEIVSGLNRLARADPAYNRILLDVELFRCKWLLIMELEYELIYILGNEFRDLEIVSKEIEEFLIFDPNAQAEVIAALEDEEIDIYGFREILESVKGQDEISEQQREQVKDYLRKIGEKEQARRDVFIQLKAIFSHFDCEEEGKSIINNLRTYAARPETAAKNFSAMAAEFGDRFGWLTTGKRVMDILHNLSLRVDAA
ncbi:MAG: hypothetical protein KAS66_09055, partial [Candidatus Omnitrophica bacterium]|nr:hypothetical protein [Candidatus Omnitrophota bacterium]